MVKILNFKFSKSCAYFGVLLSILLGSFNQGNCQATTQAPNILFFLIDDIRNTSLGCYGHPIIKTPNIDTLANSGTRFTNAFVTTSICAASRASILTGLYESTHQYTFGKPPIIKQQTDESFPNQLKEAGYQTGFIGKWGMKTEVKRESLYDYFKPINRNPYFIKIKSEADRHPSGICENHDQHFDPTFIQLPNKLRHETELCGDAAIQFLQQQKTDVPFCLQVSFNAVHAEDNDKKDHFPSPKAVEAMYENIPMPNPRLDNPTIFEAMPAFLKQSMNRDRYFWRWDTPEKYQKNMRSYFKMISGVDRVIGRIVAALKAKGMDKNTIIIITGDNGYYMGDRGFAGKWSHFEESLRVPLIIYDPRQKSENIQTEIALNIDIPATILTYGNRPIPKNYQGRNLKGLIENQVSPTWRTSFFAEHRMDINKTIPKWEGIRDERYVYANYYEQQPAYEFLHDLEKDPDQLKNLVDNPKYRRILKKMRKKVKRKEKNYF